MTIVDKVVSKSLFMLRSMELCLENLSSVEWNVSALLLPLKGG
ncbi:MAG: hypothetical protein R2788_16035 [Saprospiraceae bacterium]